MSRIPLHRRRIGLALTDGQRLVREPEIALDLEPRLMEALPPLAWRQVFSMLGLPRISLTLGVECC
jgi:hypothetical protein